MANELAVSVVIGAALQSSFNAVLGRSVNQFNRLGSAVQAASDQRQAIDAYQQLRQRVSATAQSHAQARAEVQRLQREIRSSNAVTDEQRQALARAHQEVNRLNQRLRDERRELGGQRDALRRAGVDTSQLTQENERLGRVLERLRQRYDRLGAAMRRQQANQQRRGELRGQLLDAAALGVAIAAPIRSAIQFESVMADVKKVVEFESPAGFKQMQTDILNLSTKLPMAASGIGEIIAVAGQSGRVAKSEMLGFAEDATKMAVAFDMAAGDAANAMIGLRGQFKLNQQQVVTIGDAYNHLSNNMDATARDMLNITNRTAGQANIFGLTAQQIGALGATFLALKTPPEVAATGINALLGKLGTADKQGAQFQKALEDIGFSAEEMKAAIKDDAQGALLEFLDAVKGSDDIMGTLADLFGAEYSDDMAKLVDGLDDYKKALGLVAEEAAYAGSAQNEYNERAKTTENNLQLFRNQVSKLGITIGSVLLPPLNAILGTVGPIIGGIADLANEFPLVTKVVIGTAMGLAALKIGAIATSYAFTFVKGGFLSLKVAYHTMTAAITLANTRLVGMNATLLITAVRTKALAIGTALKSFGTMLIGLSGQAIPLVIGGLKALGMALLTTPVGLIIGGIALAGTLIYKYWQPLGAFFSGLWSGFRQALSPAIDALQPLLTILSPIGAALGVVADAIGGVAGWVVDLLSPVEMASESLAGFASTGERVGAIIGKVFKTALLPITAVADAVGWVGEKWNSLFGDGENQVQFPSQAAKPEVDVPTRKPGDVINLAERRAEAQQLAELPVVAPRTSGNLALRQDAAPVPQINNTYQITIQQLPGQDARALADLVMRELEQRQALAARGGLYDE